MNTPDYVRLAIEAGQLREAGAQWHCSRECWQTGNHTPDCWAEQHYARTTPNDGSGAAS